LPALLERLLTTAGGSSGGSRELALTHLASSHSSHLHICYADRL